MGGEPISDICAELKLKLNPNMFYRWQKIFFEKGTRAFEAKGKRVPSRSEERLAKMKNKLIEKDEPRTSLGQDQTGLTERVQKSRV